MSYGNFVRAFQEFGPKKTFWKLFQLRTLKFGTLVGTDQLGNKYYENTEDYPYGQHRWVEYANDISFFDTDPSAVPAEWHSWLHCVVDEAPTSDRIGPEKTPLVETVVGSMAPYRTNLGGIVAEHTPNKSNRRPRGFGLGNGLWGSKPGEEEFYTQPGHPLDSRNSHPTPANMDFSLKDTATKLLALEAGESAALSEEEEEFLASTDIDEARAAVAKYTTMVDTYASIAVADAQAGLDDARDRLAAAEATVARWEELNMKISHAS